MNVELNDDSSGEKVQPASAQQQADQAVAEDAAVSGFEADIVRKMEELGYLDYGLDI